MKTDFKKIVFCVMAAACVAFSAPARAEGLAVDVRAGTLGPGVGLVGWLTENLNLRVGGNYLKFPFDASIDDVDYDFDMQFSSVGAMLEWHPFKNNFRISAGLIFNNNEVEVTGSPDGGSVEIGGIDFPSAAVGTLKGEAKFSPVAPYIGIGFGNAVADDVKWSFLFDIGVMFQGSPDVSVDAEGPLSENEDFKAALDREEKDIEDELEGLTIYPVVSIGFAYYFW